MVMQQILLTSIEYPCCLFKYVKHTPERYIRESNFNCKKKSVDCISILENYITPLT